MNDVRVGRILRGYEGIYYAPCLINDSTMLFVSDRQGSKFNMTEGTLSHDIWKCSIPEDYREDCSDPVNLARLNTTGNEGALTIQQDGKTFFYSVCNTADGFGLCDIYRASSDGEYYETPRNLGANINSPDWESQPSITADGSRIYFVSNRNENQSSDVDDGTTDPDMDIWYSDFDNNLGEWGPARRLSDVVNTPFNDIAPYIDADGVTLYFASSGHRPNMGGSDIYRTKRTGKIDAAGNEIWTKPEPLPAPINSMHNETFIAIPSHGKFVLFTSDREQLMSIFRAQLVR